MRIPIAMLTSHELEFANYSVNSANVQNYAT